MPNLEDELWEMRRVQKGLENRGGPQTKNLAYRAERGMEVWAHLTAP